ncbi:MAG: hypothetical protein LBF22_12740 [Deltaproteobacteria bacterium]|jgi:hypothetical protein|nr:hypothetical protein [Deltaproteobacteria bacterium]
MSVDALIRPGKFVRLGTLVFLVSFFSLSGFSLQAQELVSSQGSSPAKESSDLEGTQEPNQDPNLGLTPQFDIESEFNNFPELRELANALNVLKAEFEKDLLDTKDPKALRAFSWKASGLALLLVVAHLNPEKYVNFYEERAQSAQEIFENKKMTWESRELFGMRLYYDALCRLVVLLAAKKNNDLVLAKFQSLVGVPIGSSPRAQTLLAQEAEAAVFWSNRLVVTFPLLVELLNPSENSAVEDIVADLVNQAEVIASRRDIHLKARLDLLYQNNVSNLTKMLFLLAKSPRSPLLQEDILALEDSLEELTTVTNPELPNKISLTMVAHTMLMFPMTPWLAVGK